MLLFVLAISVCDDDVVDQYYADCDYSACYLVSRFSLADLYFIPIID